MTRCSSIARLKMILTIAANFNPKGGIMRLVRTSNCSELDELGVRWAVQLEHEDMPKGWLEREHISHAKWLELLEFARTNKAVFVIDQDKDNPDGVEVVCVQLPFRTFGFLLLPPIEGIDDTPYTRERLSFWARRIIRRPHFMWKSRWR